MNNTSPGNATEMNAPQDLESSVAAMNLSRAREADRSKHAEHEQSQPRLKLTPRDFEWGEVVGEGSYSRVCSYIYTELEYFHLSENWFLLFS